MPPEVDVPLPSVHHDSRSESDDAPRSWRTRMLVLVIRVCDAVARTAGRISERARAAVGVEHPAAHTPPTPTAPVGDVVTDEEIEDARRLFGQGSAPVDTEPSWRG